MTDEDAHTLAALLIRGIRDGYQGGFGYAFLSAESFNDQPRLRIDGSLELTPDEYQALARHTSSAARPDTTPPRRPRR